jgi:hypothetical protein
MSSVKLTADSSGGTVELKAPATTASNGAKTWVLPNDTGTAEQILKHSSTAGTLEWANNLAVAYLWDQKDYNADGGTFTQDASRTRDLNQEVDPHSIVTLSSNQFTLAAGTYQVNWNAPAYKVNNHMSFLWNNTDSENAINGSSEYAHSGTGITNQSFGQGRFTITDTKVFEIRHYCNSTFSNLGFGAAASIGSSKPSIYTSVKIIKEI